jgi:hypothetical protein
MRLAWVGILVLMIARAGHAEPAWKQWIPQLPHSPRDLQSRAADKLVPVAMRLSPGASRAPATPRIIRVRVQAATDYRRQTMDWLPRFRRTVERINSLARSWPGVRFEIVEARNWEIESSERELQALVDELERSDNAEGVDLVIGLVAAMPVFPGSVDNLGMARLLGRHMLLRGLHEVAEYDLLRSTFDILTAGEREALLLRRRLHKEQVLFLHEWAHTLGVIHAKRPSSVMYPSYEAQQSGFGEVEARVIDTVLRHQHEDGSSWIEGARAELRELVQLAPDPDWEPRERANLLALLEPGRQPARSQQQQQQQQQQRPPRPDDAPLSPADRTALGHALELVRAGKLESAWPALAPLERRYPRNAEVRALACELAWRRPPDAARISVVELACHVAAELSPRSAHPQLYLADAYLDGGDDAHARAGLLRAEELLTADGQSPAEEWRLLAALFQKARLPTLAERAAAHAGKQTELAVQTWAAELRRHTGLPSSSEPLGLEPQLEATYLQLIENGRAALGSPEERATIEAAEREFPRLSLGGILRCEAALRRGALAAARARCAPILEVRGTPSLAQLRSAHDRKLGRLATEPRIAN